MTCSDNEEESAGLQIITATKQKSTDHDVKDLAPISTSSSHHHHHHHQLRTIICPSCGHTSKFQDLQSESGGVEDLPGLPAGVKFDPSDQEIIQHLEAKVNSDAKKMHPLIDQFIPTIHGLNGICYTHPENLPGVSKEGQVRHFFHRPSKAYTTGTRKRRKVQTDDDDSGSGSETRWHKTGKTRCVSAGGYKKILVLYTNYGRQRKPEKTNWVMHQYHLGHNEDEKDGELVLSKVFYQTQPRQCATKSTSSTSTLPPAAAGPPSSTQTSTFIFNSQTIMDYYNPIIIPNLVVHADGSSPFIHHHLPSTATKAKPDNE